MSDQFARVERGFTFRCAPGQEEKVINCNASRSLLTGGMNRGLERTHRDTHVGRIGGDAVVAGPENGEVSIESVKRGTAGAGLALVAWRFGIAKVHAASTLQEVAAGRCHVSQLGGSSGKQ